MHRFRLFISHLIPNGMMPQLFHHRDQNGLGAAPGTSAQRPAWRLSLSVSLGRQRCRPGQGAFLEGSSVEGNLAAGDARQRFTWRWGSMAAEKPGGYGGG